MARAKKSETVELSPVEKKAEALKAYGVTKDSIVTLAEQKVDAEKTLANLRGLPCKTRAQIDWHKEQLTNITALYSSIDDKRTAITKPMNAAKRAVDDLFNPVLKPLKSGEEICREKIIAGERELLIQEEKVLKAIAAASEAGDTKAIQKAVASLPQTSDSEHASTKRTWAVKSVDIARVPVYFLQLNEKLVEAFIKEHLATGSTEPPVLLGVEFEVDVALRRKSV